MDINPNPIPENINIIKPQTCKFYSPLKTKFCKHYIDGLKDEAGFCKRASQFRCIEALKIKLPSVSQSAIKMFCHCRERYYKHYIQGITLRDEHLPLPIKCGSVWDTFVDSLIRTPGEFLNINYYIERYHLYPEDVAKLQAIMRAYRNLEITLPPDGITQYQIFHNIGDTTVTGYLDIAYEDSIAEVKLSARPDFYTNLENIHLQVGTYLMTNPEWEYADMLITRLPGLRTGNGKFSNESMEEYRLRVYSDIISRPSYYFIGYNRKTKMYGKRFYRSEFNFQELEQTYLDTLKLMRFCIDNNIWGTNTLACHVPAKCEFLSFRKTGVISDTLYRYMDTSEIQGGMR